MKPSSFLRLRSLNVLSLPPPRRYEGKARGSAYPHSVVFGIHLWAICSENEEDIEVACIPLAQFNAQ